jgi:hypothetical protein
MAWVWVTLHGLRVWVPSGMGTGYDSSTRGLLNKPKKYFWTKTEGDMTDFVNFIEISPISFNSGLFWTFLGSF